MGCVFVILNCMDWFGLHLNLVMWTALVMWFCYAFSFWGYYPFTINIFGVLLIVFDMVEVYLMNIVSNKNLLKHKI